MIEYKLKAEGSVNIYDDSENPDIEKIRHECVEKLVNEPYFNLTMRLYKRVIIEKEKESITTQPEFVLVEEL